MKIQHRTVIGKSATKPAPSFLQFILQDRGTSRVTGYFLYNSPLPEQPDQYELHLEGNVNDAKRKNKTVSKVIEPT